MGSGTGIEWTEVTWNPTTGCDRISAGCDHCYALTLARRLKAMGQAKYQADGPPSSQPRLNRGSRAGRTRRAGYKGQSS
jgi:protein gp37